MKLHHVHLAALLIMLPVAASCGSPFGGDTLAALKVDGQPTRADWERAVPLDLEVWKGNVNVRPEIVALDQETSHRSTAQCHHGPANSEPVKVRLQAFYDDRHLYLLVRWADPTADRDLGHWSWDRDEWKARPLADDGFAILWGPGAGAGGTPDPFRCQSSCHMVEVDVYDGGTQMRMGMRHDGPGGLDLWRWRSGVTDPYRLADDMVVDRKGKRGDEGQMLMSEPLEPTGTGKAPYRGTTVPGGRQGDVRADSRWSAGWWEILFRRALDTSDPDDVVFEPGSSIPFSISVFDGTFTEHHVLDLGANLVLVQEKEPGYAGERGNSDDLLDY